MLYADWQSVYLSISVYLFQCLEKGNTPYLKTLFMSSFFFSLLSIILYQLFENDGVAIISDSLPGFFPTQIQNDR